MYEEAIQRTAYGQWLDSLLGHRKQTESRQDTQSLREADTDTRLLPNCPGCCPTAASNVTSTMSPSPRVGTWETHWFPGENTDFQDGCPGRISPSCIGASLDKQGRRCMGVLLDR